MSEQVFVNISHKPYIVSLPTGRPYAIQPHYAVQGDHFRKFISSGEFVPLAAIPAKFTVKGITSPLASEGVRGDSQAPNHNKSKLSRPAPAQAAKPKTAAMAMAEAGKTSPQEVADGILAGTPGYDSDASSTFEGLTFQGWKERLAGISDATFGQHMKLAQLRGLAKFLAIESADILQTKVEFITAIRMRLR